MKSIELDVPPSFGAVLQDLLEAMKEGWMPMLVVLARPETPEDAKLLEAAGVDIHALVFGLYASLSAEGH